MAVQVLALFGPTGVGKTAIAIAIADVLRASGERPVAVSADALQVYRGLEILTGVPDRDELARLEHRLIAFVAVDARFSVAEYARLAHAEIDGLLADGATPIVVGGTGLYLRAALAELALRPPPPPGARERWNAQLDAHGPQALHARLAREAPWAAATIEPGDSHRIVRSLELLEQGALTPPRGPNRLWTADTRRPTRLVGLVRDRDELYRRIDRRVDAMIEAGVADEVRRAVAAGASPTARVALGFDELLAGDVEAMKRRTRNYARRQLTWMRKLPGVELVDVAGRTPQEVAAAILDGEGARTDAAAVIEHADPGPRRPGSNASARHRSVAVARIDSAPAMAPIAFEKWQALGNDYLVVEERALPFALTTTRIRRICDAHLGIGSDGILLLSAPDEPGFVARLRIFNPDGSEAELSGNGAREAVLYLRHRGWTDSDRFSIQTAAGEIRPTITGPTTCTLDMGRARTSSGDFPSGDPDGAGTLTTSETTWRFQHVQVGNPQCAIHVPDLTQLDALDLPAIGTAIVEHELFPNRTNVSWFGELEPGVIRARIFERGVGETMSSGTGASGAAIAYVLRGGDSPVTVRLDGGQLVVEVEEDLHYTLSGWAVCVYRGELADDFREHLESL